MPAAMMRRPAAAPKSKAAAKAKSKAAAKAKSRAAARTTPTSSPERGPHNIERLRAIYLSHSHKLPGYWLLLDSHHMHGDVVELLDKHRGFPWAGFEPLDENQRFFKVMVMTIKAYPSGREEHGIILSMSETITVMTKAVLASSLDAIGYPHDL